MRMHAACVQDEEVKKDISKMLTDATRGEHVCEAVEELAPNLWRYGTQMALLAVHLTTTKKCPSATRIPYCHKGEPQAQSAKTYDDKHRKLQRLPFNRNRATAAHHSSHTHTHCALPYAISQRLGL